ncbi:ferredoxin [Desulfonatronum thiosulfatophilum]|uniref:Ferredoxin n=1 Tax=Desulfonatronum thiosulfatophilum TaxID=617002 RepID=A0A1G6CAL1_9BACT|nr:ferredoxin [Desulfonatronum thiosulfatophilum]SDB29929.1 ferredoxin [Desulfonatronum thiosulfatophilum]
MTNTKQSTNKADLELDLEHCSGCQACLEMCPEVFGWDDNLDKPVLKESSGPRDQVLQVAAFCPMDCIRVAGWKRDW